MTQRPNSQHKEGIAVVIVLGFLSVLLIIGVAFAITMRTERLAARAYVDNVKARQLMFVAVGRAMDEIDTRMTGRVFSETNAFPSSAAGAAVEEMIGGTALDYIPRSLRQAASNQASSVRWQLVRDPISNRVIGRYAFLCLDCSGLLDANYIGGMTRGRGTNTGEFSFGNLPEAQNDTLSPFRTEFVRFESVAELYRLCANDTGPAARALRYLPQSYADNLFTYSRYPLGYANPAGIAQSNLVYIGGNLAQVQATQSFIQTAFDNIPAIPDAQIMMWNLIDYLDSDNEPANGNGRNNFCTEPVPMLNEIIISNTVGSFSDVANNYDSYSNRLDVTVELWYPFATINSNNYSVSVRVVSSGGTAQFRPTLSPAATPTELGPWPSGAGGRYRVIKLPPIVATFSNSPSGAGVPTLPDSTRFEFKVLERPSGTIVDEIMWNPGFVLTWASTFVSPVPPLGETRDVVLSKSADDPRINWDWQDPAQWRVEPITTGTQNRALTYSDPSETNMYVRNSANLPNVGELGFLLFSGKPWSTIQIASPANGTEAVLDYFTVATDDPQKGLLNINTRNPNALIALFANMPLEMWPAYNAVSPATVNVTLEQATNYAVRLISDTSSRNLTNISEIAGCTSFAGATNNFLIRECIVRNSAGLLGVRNNTFTVFLAAQAVDDAAPFGTVDSEEEIRGEQRAVAVIWRDAYKDPSTQKHPMFTRLFKWLIE